MSCTVAPGFDFADFEMPPRAKRNALQNRRLTNVEPQNTHVPPVDTDAHFDIRKSTFGNLRFPLPIQLAQTSGGT